MGKKSLIVALCFLMWLTVIVACGGGGGDSGGGVVIVLNPNIVVDSQVNYSGTVIGNRQEQTITIRNTGNGRLRVGQITVSGSSFGIVNDPCSNQPLESGASCDLTTYFSPTAQGMRAGALTIPSNDPDTAVAQVSLAGEGYGLNVWINRVQTEHCPAVSLDVTVNDPQNPGTALSLGENNFSVTYGGEQPIIAMFEIVDSSPVSVVLALDMSSSLSGAIGDIKTAAIRFINLLDDDSEAAICRFRDGSEFFPASTLLRANESGKNEMANYITNVPVSPPQGTALYDAIYESIDRAALGTTGKPAVVVLSDGANNRGVRSLADVVSKAIATGVPVFAVFYVDDAQAASARPDIMQQIAVRTGGQFYHSNVTSLNDIFEQVAGVLSNKYTITFTAPNTCLGATYVRADWEGLYGADSR